MRHVGPTRVIVLLSPHVPVRNIRDCQVRRDRPRPEFRPGLPLQNAKTPRAQLPQCPSSVIDLTLCQMTAAGGREIIEDESRAPTENWKHHLNRSTGARYRSAG